MKTENRKSSIVPRQCRGFTLLEAMMAMVLLAIAASAVLLPFSAAAAAQSDAQRRVAATRFAADVIEILVAGQALNPTVVPEDLGASYAGEVYAGLVGQIQVVNDYDGFDGLTLVTVSVSHNGRQMATLKTLAGS